MSLAVHGRKEGYSSTLTTASVLFRAEPVEELCEPIPGDAFLFFMCGSGVWECSAFKPPLAYWDIGVPFAVGSPAAP